MGFGRSVQGRGEGGNGEDEHRQGEHQAQPAAVVGGEALPAVFDSADDEGQAEDQQHIRQDRPHEGGFHHTEKPGLEREENDEQLRQISQRRLQYPRGTGSEAVAECFHRTADQ